MEVGIHFRLTGKNTLILVCSPKITPDGLSLMHITRHHSTNTKQRKVGYLAPHHLAPPLRLGGQVDDYFQQKIPYPHRVLSLKRPAQLLQDGHDYHGFKTTKSLISNTRHLAVGDLHGSWERLLETLVVANLTRLTPKQAAAFYKLSDDYYALLQKSPQFDDPHVVKQAQVLAHQYLTLLNGLTWQGGRRQLTLMGDTVCDRGQSDLFILALLDTMRHSAKQQGVDDPFQIIYSNHDHKALKLFYDHYLHDQQPTYHVFIGRWFQNYQLVKQDPQLFKSMQRLYKDHFSRQRTLHYEPKQQALFSHGAINQTLTQDLLQHLGVSAPHAARSSRQLQSLVHQVNKKVQQHYIRPALVKAPDEVAKVRIQTHLKAPHLEQFLAARKHLTTPNQIPFSSTALRYHVHGHTITHDGLHTAEADATAPNPPQPKPDKPFTLPEVLSLKKPGLLGWAGAKLQRISLDNCARFDQKFLYPLIDQAQVVSKLLIVN
jgi:hypothetical protein